MIEGEAEKLERLVDEGATVGFAKAHRDLAARVRRFIEDLEVVIDGEQYDTNITKNWKKRAIDTRDKALGRGAAVTEEAVTHEED